MHLNRGVLRTAARSAEHELQMSALKNSPKPLQEKNLYPAVAEMGNDAFIIPEWLMVVNGVFDYCVTVSRYRRVP